MSNKTHSPLSEILRFWFAMLSPLIGIGLGFVAAWFVGSLFVVISDEPILLITGIRVYDAAGNVIETHEHAGNFK